MVKASEPFNNRTPWKTNPGLDPTNKKSWIQLFFWKYLKILEASSHDRITCPIKKSDFAYP